MSPTTTVTRPLRNDVLMISAFIWFYSCNSQYFVSFYPRNAVAENNYTCVVAPLTFGVFIERGQLPREFHNQTAQGRRFDYWYAGKSGLQSRLCRNAAMNFFR